MWIFFSFLGKAIVKYDEGIIVQLNIFSLLFLISCLIAIGYFLIKGAKNSELH